MRLSHRWAGLALLIGLTLPLAAADDAKDKKKDLDKEKPKEAEKLVPLGQYTGVLTSIGGSDKLLTVKITIRYMEPNASAFQNQQNLIRRQAEVMRQPNPIERQRQLAQLAYDMAQNQRNLYTKKEVSKDVDVQVADGAKVRSINPPLAFDDKGNPRKYTQKELKELRGDEKLPGYNSDLDALRTGQTVTLSLATKKDANPARQKGKDLDKDLEKKLLDDNRPYATMIVIVSEAINP